MAQLILVRHGQTDWDRQDRVQGALDIPLNSEGQKEAQKITEDLSKIKIDKIYSSPVSCSYATACEIAAPHKLKVKKIQELGELNHGVWQGLLIKDIKKRYRKQFSIWKSAPSSGKPPKGETMRAAYDRSVSAIQKIVDKHKDENICIVSHDIILSLIKCRIKSVDLDKAWDFILEKGWWETVKI